MRLFRYRTCSPLLLLPLLMLAHVLPAKGQVTRVRVESASVAEGATSVPLQTEIRFTLNQAVTLGDLDGDAFVTFPEEAITYAEGTPTLSADGRTLTYTVTHQADTDYTWLLVGGSYTVDDGEVQGIYLEPYVLRYTTAATLGALEVSGEVSINEAIEGEVVEGTIVFLTEANILDEEEAETVAAAVADASGSYTIPNLRADVGVVYPFAIKIPEATSPDLLEDQFDFIGYLGFYDEDEDDAPDAITIGTASVDGIDILVRPFDFLFLTAEEAQARADELAAEVAGDQQLLAILGVTFGASGGGGRALTWQFLYYSAALGQRTTVMVAPLESEVAAAAFTPTGTIRPLPATYLASADAFAAAEAQGGTDFRAQYGAEDQVAFTYFIAGIDVLLETDDEDDLAAIPEDLTLPETSDPYWTVLYIAFNFGVADPAYLAVFIDMQTGTVIGTDAEGFVVASEDEAALPEDVRAGRELPEPVQPHHNHPLRAAPARPRPPSPSTTRSARRWRGSWTATWQQVSTRRCGGPARCPAGRISTRWRQTATSRPRALTLLK